jgi:hypothetical protein
MSLRYEERVSASPFLTSVTYGLTTEDGGTIRPMTLGNGRALFKEKVNLDLIRSKYLTLGRSLFITQPNALRKTQRW